MSEITRMSVAGLFYPAGVKSLQEARELVAGDRASWPSGKLRGLIVPHAGWQFSGSVAANGYRYLKGESYKKVVLLAPAHRLGFHGLAVPTSRGFEVPGGVLNVDFNRVEHLVREGKTNGLNINFCDDAFEGEHAVEVQLPFLSAVLGDFSLIPILCGEVDRHEWCDYVTLLGQLWGEDILWVISSDFTHFGPNFGYVPFNNDVPSSIRQLDHEAVNWILKNDVEAFDSFLEDTGATICGRVPIRLLMGVTQDEVLERISIDYLTSGDLTGDFQHSVSYCTVGLFQDLELSQTIMDSKLNSDDKRLLLQLARHAIERRLAGAGPVMNSSPESLPNLLEEKGACFVTLKKGTELRGCIGHLTAFEPLYLNVIHNAEASAFSDPRFNAVTADEFGNLVIEISVLTPAVQVRSYSDIELGRDGVILEVKGHRAVFLPQVAIEQGWDLVEMLTHLALKAGLKANDWRIKGAVLSVFRAHVFSELDQCQ